MMRSILMPGRSHQTDSFERLNEPLGEAKGTPLSERIARRMIGDGQRIAVAFVAEQELALIVGAPQVLRTEAFR